MSSPPSRTASGIVLILVAVLGFSLLDSTVKHLSLTVPMLLVVWTRYAMQALLMTGWLLRPGPRPPLRIGHPRFQVLRGTLLLATSVLAYFGLKTMPVAEFTAIAMLAPVFVTLASPLVLREPVGTLRWVLVAVAFAGGLVIVRPGAGVFGAAAAYPLAVALAGASFQVLTRRMATLEDPLITHGATGVVGTVWLTLGLLLWPASWQPALDAIGPPQWALMAVAGLFGTFGHLAFIHALARAPMPVLMPFTYAQIAYATLLGALFFGQRPDGWSMAGMGLIAASGAVSAWVNVRRARPSVVAADTAIGD